MSLGRRPLPPSRPTDRPTDRPDPRTLSPRASPPRTTPPPLHPRLKPPLPLLSLHPDRLVIMSLDDEVPSALADHVQLHACGIVDGELLRLTVKPAPAPDHAFQPDFDNGPRLVPFVRAQTPRYATLRHATLRRGALHHAASPATTRALGLHWVSFTPRTPPPAPPPTSHLISFPPLPCAGAGAGQLPTPHPQEAGGRPAAAAGRWQRRAQGLVREGRDRAAGEVGRAAD